MAEAKNRSAVLAEASLILAAVSWGLNFAATKYAAELVPPLVFMALRFAGGGLLLFVVLRAFEPASRLERRDLLPMAALGCFGVAAAQTGFTYDVSMTSAASTGLIFTTAFAFSAWQAGISRIGANRVLVYQYLVTVTGDASGIVFFGEVLGVEKILGGAVILIGVYLARRQ